MSQYVGYWWVFCCTLRFSAMERNGEQKKKAKNEVVDDDPEDEEEDAAEDDTTKRTTAASSSAVASARRGGNLSPPCCQAEMCTADLKDAKRYHRRHKVCEHHFKAPIVIVAGLRQRFCQQCSRFHELSEFDEAKRSCRRRLAGHNERRRKNSSSESHAEGSSRKGVDPQLKENHCRQADQNGRMPASLPGNSTYKHFQIR